MRSGYRLLSLLTAFAAGCPAGCLTGCGGSEDAERLLSPSGPKVDASVDAASDASLPQDAGPGDAVAEHPAPEPTLGDLVVDANRNGALEPWAYDEQAFENTWNESYGAVLLANVDDDDEDGVGDHLDDIVNGPQDVPDLARIRLVGYDDVPEGAVGTIRIDAASVPWVRVYRVQGDAFVLQDPARIEVSSADLAQGLEFVIEARFFTVSLAPDAWTGFVDIEHEVTNQGVELARDSVRMRVAPLVFMHNLMKTDRIWVGDFDHAFVTGVKHAAQAAGVPVEVLEYEAAGYEDNQHDQWTQDHFEMGYTSMPGPDGLHTMLVAFRTPRVKRTSADVVFVEFLGPDFGAIHVHATPYDDATRSLDSTGNWDTVPPHEAHGVSYPHGRFILGSVPERHPDPVAEDFVEAQRVQPMLRVDTSWLSVGHVDEYLSFVPADNARGWQMLFARPALAVKMLEQLQAQGQGDARMHEGKWWWWGPAERSVDEVLADADLMATNQEDQVILDGILAQLKDELALGEDEVTYMPFLEFAISGGSVAYQPGSVNLLHFDRHVLVADPFGPEVGGADIFKQDLDTRLGELGLTVHYVDDWDTYHRNNGETHCATNALRVVPDDDAWWEAGR
ncbi:MAG: protein-arginine deiminase family protein [Myxococcota bacterium]